MSKEQKAATLKCLPPVTQLGLVMVALFHVGTAGATMAELVELLGNDVLGVGLGRLGPEEVQAGIQRAVEGNMVVIVGGVHFAWGLHLRIAPCADAQTAATL